MGDFEKMFDDILKSLESEDEFGDLIDEMIDDEEIYQALYAHYVHEMPYGTAKARTGDPEEWIIDTLYREFPTVKELRRFKELLEKMN